MPRCYSKRHITTEDAPQSNKINFTSVWDGLRRPIVGLSPPWPSCAALTNAVCGGVCLYDILCQTGYDVLCRSPILFDIHLRPAGIKHP